MGGGLVGGGHLMAFAGSRRPQSSIARFGGEVGKVVMPMTWLAQPLHRPKLTYNRAMPEGYVTVAQAAEILDCKPQQVRDMIQANLIKESDREKVGTSWLIKRDALEGLSPRPVGRPKKKGD